MNSQGLIGFRIREQNKLIYNQSNSRPDMLGLQILNELREIDDWNAIKSRISQLNVLPETQHPGYHDGMLNAELRRHFPDLQFKSNAADYHNLFKPLQGSLKPYLDGRLSFMPSASDFIRDSRHCKWAYIANLDTDEFEVWKGNQIEPDSEDNRLVEEPNRYGSEPDRMGHYPCAMVKNYSLDDLPNPGLFLTYYSFAGDIDR